MQPIFLILNTSGEQCFQVRLCLLLLRLFRVLLLQSFCFILASFLQFWISVFSCIFSQWLLCMKYMSLSWFLIICMNNSLTIFGKNSALWNLPISYIKTRISYSKFSFQLEQVCDLDYMVWEHDGWIWFKTVKCEKMGPVWSFGSICLCWQKRHLAFRRKDDLLSQKWHWCWKV